METLLTRSEFREGVFKRDNYKCIICSKPAKDAHHIIERRLWEDEGYYISNGVSLCEDCHMKAEQTILSCEELRVAAKIDKIILPNTFYIDEKYDKWGNVFLPNRLRVKGELFFGGSVQKILKEGGVLDQFTKYVKYPKTHHLPWSPGITEDDRVMSYENLNKYFDGKEVVVTEKVDGEGMTLYPDYIHARSIDGRNHVSRNWVKNFHAKIKYDIPEGWRICGENLYAQHSIYYSNLPSYFLVFSIFNEKNICLSFIEMVEYCKLLGLSWVQPLYIGEYHQELVKNIYTGKSLYSGEQEGYVMRLSSEMNWSQYKYGLAKYVRKDHVKTSHNWMYKTIVKNKLS